MPGTPYVVVHDGRSRAGWLLERERTIGASDVPSIYGVSPFGSPYKVWADKSGYGDPFTESPITLFGHYLEPIILENYGASTERVVRRDGRLLRSRKYPWLSCTLDARQWTEVLEPGRLQKSRGTFLGAVEAKSTIDDWSDGLPIDVVLQVQTQYIVTGFERIDVAWLERMSAQFKHAHVPRNDAMIVSILDETQRFWEQHIQKGEPPETDGSESCMRALQRIYPSEVPGEIVEADEELAAKAARMKRLTKAAGKLQKEASAIKNELRATIGTGEYLRMPDGSGFAYREEKETARVMRAINSVDKTIAKRSKIVRAA